MKRDRSQSSGGGIAAPLISGSEDPAGAITAPPPADAAGAEQLDHRQDRVRIGADPALEVSVSGHRDTEPATTPSRALPPVAERESATDLEPIMATAEILGRLEDAGPEATAPSPAEAASPLLRLRGRVGRAIPSLRSGRFRLLAVVGVGLVLLAGSTGFLAHENARLADQLRATALRQDGRIAALRSDLGTATGATNSLSEDVSRLTSRADDQLDTTAVAPMVAPSVYEVRAGDEVGSAWVAASSGGASQFITNAHVVAATVDAGQTSVTLVQGATVIPATIARLDRDSDLAVLTAQRALPVLPQASEKVAAGDPLMVIGSALGLEGSVTSGIVSAIRTADGRDYIQLSAPVNFGNSGGPVVDRHRRVIGVTVIKLVGFGTEGLAFAIPISTVCRTVISCTPPTSPHVGGPLRPS
jgi:S1-C subfamily serine protease